MLRFPCMTVASCRCACLVAIVAFSSAANGAETEPLVSRPDPALSEPISLVRADPFVRMGDKQALIQRGEFRLVYEKLGEIPAERFRLPTPGATWKLTGRVGRLADRTIVAGFGTFLYASTDEGRSWRGRLIDNLPKTDGPTNLRAFGVSGEHTYLAHHQTAQPRLHVPDREVYPVAISRSSDLGRTWHESFVLPIPKPYTFLAGDGNHIIGLPDGTLVAALDAANSNIEATTPGWLTQVFFRSQNQGQTWDDASFIDDKAAEVGLLSLGGNRVLAARRGMSNPQLGGKTIQLADSEDGGRTWKNLRQLTWVFGQAHGDLALLPGAGIVAVYENRYPVSHADIRARVSWDLGATWEPELYILAKGVGYAGSVAAADGTIVTVTGDGQTAGGKPAGRGYTLQALRWKPLAKKRK